MSRRRPKLTTITTAASHALTNDMEPIIDMIKQGMLIGGIYGFVTLEGKFIGGVGGVSVRNKDRAIADALRLLDMLKGRDD